MDRYKDVIQSKCKWSPMEGHEYQWQVEQTFCNGHLIYNKGCLLMLLIVVRS